MRRAALILLLLAFAPLAAEQAPVPEYDLKAELLRRFTMFVEWPETAMLGSEFIIGVIGESPLVTSLEAHAATEPIKERRVVVKRIANLEELDRCHILFIASSAESKLPRILKRTRTRPVLTVGDSAGFAEKGVLINFFLEANQVRFEINEQAVRATGLHFRAQLFRAARVIGPEGQFQ
jgi:hypothetical protein